MKNKPSIHQKQSQKLLMTTRMQQAIDVMALPLADLHNWMNQQILENPLIELDRTSCASPFDPTAEVSRDETLVDFLRKEFTLLFPDAHQRQIAESLCGFLDEKGFVSSSYEEIALICKYSASEVAAVASKISQLDPPGIATLNISHSLLAQLQKYGKEKSVAYQIILNYWNELLKNEKRKICSALNLSQTQLNAVIEKDIRPLNPYPASDFEKPMNSSIQPDLIIYQQDQTLCLKNASDDLLKVTISENYRDIAQDCRYVRACISHAKWLTDTLFFRNTTLEKIGQYILQTGQRFFSGLQHAPEPLTSAQLAEELELSLSTIYRALQHKYIDTPRGTFPLTYFTTTTKLKTQQHKGTIEQALLQIVQTENKQSPLSDQQIALHMKEHGLTISRRTVAKYRTNLNIPPCFSRKNS